MSILAALFRPIGTFLDRIFCLVVAVMLTQFPAYMSQYVDVLSGAHMEAERSYVELEDLAVKYHLTVQEYLSTLARNDNAMVRENIEKQQQDVDRFMGYDQALTALREASVWTKPLVLAEHFNPAIHDAMAFEPQVPMTEEGVVYALIGLILALTIISILKGMGRMFTRDPMPPTFKPKTSSTKPVSASAEPKPVEESTN
ncbi:DUF2937 family protein [Pontibacter sp. G13]|uniref:DUF2937 family protein n=1 Tax=Pontibacter sp. G13 TaxID=3074898 RepID=UPI00288A887A|nr:DUF2937 family protein [Pontibacter sp. G13]WNJ21256.1 DUF2937 family protein [Pontibacter sp. G13]